MVVQTDDESSICVAWHVHELLNAYVKLAVRGKGAFVNPAQFIEDLGLSYHPEPYSKGVLDWLGSDQEILAELKRSKGTRVLPMG